MAGLGEAQGEEGRCGKVRGRHGQLRINDVRGALTGIDILVRFATAA